MSPDTTVQATRWRAEQQALAARAMLTADALWRKVDPRRIQASWKAIAAQMTALLISAQQASAEGAQAYVAAVVGELGGTSRPEGTLTPAAFAGWAADGRSLSSLLELPPITALTEIAAGAPEDLALQRSRSQLMRIMSTEVADAGRSAVGASITANRTCTGYVRVVSGGACSRCIVLAGQIYGSWTAFKRHPHCMCVHEPTIRGRKGATVNPDQYFRELSRAEQDRRFGRAGAQALRDGGDISAIVNARRRGAVYTADAYGRRVLATREGTTRRGSFYRQERDRTSARTGIRFARDRTEARSGLPRFELRTPRLMPEEIYRLAENRAEAIAMLRRFGYIR
ncbi:MULTISPECIES: VG15 protein [Bacillati]|uniref:VG15 protein n=1 Tax=Bacillati TaxID=1783272 RepID=UPI00341960EA